MYLLLFEVFGTVLLTGLKWLRNNLSSMSTTWYDLTMTGQRGKLYEKKKKISFDFHILPEHRRIGGRIFPCRCIFNKNRDHPWGRCWPIYLESKQSLNGWIAIEESKLRPYRYILMQTRTHIMTINQYYSV